MIANLDLLACNIATKKNIKILFLVKKVFETSRVIKSVDSGV